MGASRSPWDATSSLAVGFPRPRGVKGVAAVLGPPGLPQGGEGRRAIGPEGVRRVTPGPSCGRPTRQGGGASRSPWDATSPLPIASPRLRGVDAVAAFLGAFGVQQARGERLPILSPLGSAFTVPVPAGLEPGKVYVGKSVFGYRE